LVAAPRMRRSLGTSDIATAIERRDVLFARLGQEGEPVPPRQKRLQKAETEAAEMRQFQRFLLATNAAEPTPDTPPTCQPSA